MSVLGSANMSQFFIAQSSSSGDSGGAIMGIAIIALLIAVTVFTLIMRRAGLEGRAVLYTSWGDVFASVGLPIAGFIAGAALMGSAEDSGGSAIPGILILLVSAVWFFGFNIRQAMHWNSRQMGIRVAIFRIFFALVWILAVFAVLGLLNPNTKKGGVTVAKGAIAYMICIAIVFGMYRFFSSLITPPRLASA